MHDVLRSYHVGPNILQCLLKESCERSPKPPSQFWDLPDVYFLHWTQRRNYEGDRGWDGWMASLTRWAWVWVNSGSLWWTGRPDVLRFMGSQRVGHDWATELNWTEDKSYMWYIFTRIWIWRGWLYSVLVISYMLCKNNFLELHHICLTQHGI